MQEKDDSKRLLPQFRTDVDSFDRRSIDRRKHASEGYTYISTVGWICRRERSRRECDCPLKTTLASKPSIVLKTKRVYRSH
jgi:hypothetical protein